MPGLGAAGKVKGRNWCFSADLKFSAYIEQKQLLSFAIAKEKDQTELILVLLRNSQLT